MKWTLLSCIKYWRVNFFLINFCCILSFDVDRIRWLVSLAEFAFWGLPLLFMQLSAVFASRLPQVFPIYTPSRPLIFLSMCVGVCLVSLCDFHICCHFELFQWLLTASRLAGRRLRWIVHQKSTPFSNCQGKSEVYAQIILYYQWGKSSTNSSSTGLLWLL